jgi:hypothetical protein
MGSEDAWMRAENLEDAGMRPRTGEWNDDVFIYEPSKNECIKEEDGTIS